MSTAEEPTTFRHRRPSRAELEKALEELSDREVAVETFVQVAQMRWEMAWLMGAFKERPSR